jgi:hypothetical protein
MLSAWRAHPAAREKLAASAQRQREATAGMLEQVHARVGAAPGELPAPVRATISTSLFDALAVGRLIDPTAFTRRSRSSGK